MINLRATVPRPNVEEGESKFGGEKVVFEWSTERGGLRVTIAHGRAPVWTDGRVSGEGLDAEFLAAMDRVGIKRATP